jgi:hypothetical protein
LPLRVTVAPATVKPGLATPVKVQPVCGFMVISALYTVLAVKFAPAGAFVVLLNHAIVAFH